MPRLTKLREGKERTWPAPEFNMEAQERAGDRGQKSYEGRLSMSESILRSCACRWSLSVWVHMQGSGLGEPGRIYMYMYIYIYIQARRIVFQAPFLLFMFFGLKH